LAAIKNQNTDPRATADAAQPGAKPGAQSVAQHGDPVIGITQNATPPPPPGIAPAASAASANTVTAAPSSVSAASAGSANHKAHPVPLGVGSFPVPPGSGGDGGGPPPPPGGVPPPPPPPPGDGGVGGTAAAPAAPSSAPAVPFAASFSSTSNQGPASRDIPNAPTFKYTNEIQERLDNIDAEIAWVGQHVDLTGDKLLADVQKLMFQCATGFLNADDQKIPGTTTYTVNRARFATANIAHYFAAIKRVLELETLVCKLVRKKSVSNNQKVRQQAYFVGLLLYALAKYVTESETLKTFPELAKLAHKIFIHVKDTTIKAMCPIMNGRVTEKHNTNAFEGDVMTQGDEEQLKNEMKKIKQEYQDCGK
jgi:hypothetical protein